MKKKRKKKNRRPATPSGEASVQCPYCWEHFTIAVDSTGGDLQRFVWDCEVCCRPIDVTLQFEPGLDPMDEPTLTVAAERAQ